MKLTLKFSGTFRELKNIMKKMDREGIWNRSLHHYTFLDGPGGGLFRWHPETGKITFPVMDRSMVPFIAKVNSALEAAVRPKVVALPRTNKSTAGKREKGHEWSRSSC